MDESCHTSEIHFLDQNKKSDKDWGQWPCVTRRNKSCHKYEWVMSREWMSHVTRTNESCHTYESVMSQIWNALPWPEPKPPWRYSLFPRRWDSKSSSECKSKSWMVKVQVSFQMSNLKRDLWWPSRISFCIPRTISSLIFSGTGCRCQCTSVTCEHRAFQLQLSRTNGSYHIRMSHVTYEWVISHVSTEHFDYNCHIRMGHITYMNESCHMCARSIPTTMVTYEWVIPPVPEKTSLEIVIGMQNEILIGIKKLLF